MPCREFTDGNVLLTPVNVEEEIEECLRAVLACLARSIRGRDVDAGLASVGEESVKSKMARLSDDLGFAGG